MFYIHGGTKEFQCIAVNGGKIFKLHFDKFILNKIK